MPAIHWTHEYNHPQSSPWTLLHFRVGGIPNVRVLLTWSHPHSVMSTRDPALHGWHPPCVPNLACAVLSELKPPTRSQGPASGQAIPRFCFLLRPDLSWPQCLPGTQNTREQRWGASNPNLAPLAWVRRPQSNVSWPSTQPVTHPRKENLRGCHGESGL